MQLTPLTALAKFSLRSTAPTGSRPARAFAGRAHPEGAQRKPTDYFEPVCWVYFASSTNNPRTRTPTQPLCSRIGGAGQFHQSPPTTLLCISILLILSLTLTDAQKTIVTIGQESGLESTSSQPLMAQLGMALRYA